MWLFVKEEKNESFVVNMEIIHEDTNLWIFIDTKNEKKKKKSKYE